MTGSTHLESSSIAAQSARSPFAARAALRSQAIAAAEARATRWMPRSPLVRTIDLIGTRPMAALLIAVGVIELAHRLT